MTVLGLVSAKGSPGVTTSCLAFAAVWPRPVLLAECDPAGGDITAGYLHGQPLAGGGLLQVALAARRRLTTSELLDRCLRLTADDSVLLLTGLTDPAQHPTLAGALPAIGAAFTGLGRQVPARDVLIDAGRLDATHGGLLPLLAGCDLVVLVVRPTLRQVDAARPRLAALRHRLAGPGAVSPQLGLLVVGDGPYRPVEVAQVLGLPLVGVLPADRDTAAVLSDGAGRRRGFDRAPLIRAARHLAATLAGDADAAPGQPGPLAPDVTAPDLITPALAAPAGGAR